MELPASEKFKPKLLGRLIKKANSKSPRWGLLASGLLLAIGIVLVFVSLAARSHLRSIDIPEESLLPVAGPVMSESEPVRLRIAALDVDVPFVRLGLQSNGEIEIPDGYDEVGWYTYGPTPGELGPAVVLGHVDSRLGPAVFFYLGQLEPGDIVEIDRADGTTASFRVDKLERYEQAEFPTDLVYGDIDHAGLRLITCSGIYDRGSRRYDMNLVVYASLIESGDSLVL